MRLINLEIDRIKGFSDNKIREFVCKNLLNGAYASTICKNCGSVLSSPETNCKDAKILNKCKKCFEPG